MNALIRCPHDAMVWLGSFTWLSAEPMSVKAQNIAEPYLGSIPQLSTYPPQSGCSQHCLLSGLVSMSLSQCQATNKELYSVL